MQLIAAILLILGLIFLVNRVVKKEDGGAAIRRSYQDSGDEDKTSNDAHIDKPVGLMGLPKLKKEIKDELDRSDRKELDELINQVDK